MIFKRSSHSSKTIASIWLLSIAGLSCSSNSESEVIYAPVGPPSLQILEPTEGSCVPLRQDASSDLRVLFSVTNWTMRPRGYCGLAPQCGFAVISIDDIFQVNTAGFTAIVPIDGRMRSANTHTLTVALYDDKDKAATDTADKPLTQSVTFRLTDTCEEISDGGLDASPDVDGSLPSDDASTDAAVASVEDADANAPDVSIVDADSAVHDGSQDTGTDHANNTGDVLDAGADQHDVTTDVSIDGQ